MVVQQMKAEILGENEDTESNGSAGGDDSGNESGSEDSDQVAACLPFTWADCNWLGIQLHWLNLQT